jgi:hypothetical protein
LGDDISTSSGDCRKKNTCKGGAVVNIGRLVTERVLLMCVLFFSTQVFAEEGMHGKAYDQGSGELLYSERYSCSQDGLKCSVEYTDAADVLIAYKELDFSISSFRPTLSIQDYRSDMKIEIGFEEDDNLVVDAGFDRYLRSKWTELDNGEVVKFSFLVVGYEDPLKMRAERRDSDSCIQEELCLEISLDSWFLGLLADPIALAYSRDERRLLRYQGLSNMRAENGDSLQVSIQYHYSEQAVADPGAVKQRNAAYEF